MTVKQAWRIRVRDDGNNPWYELEVETPIEITDPKAFAEVAAEGFVVGMVDEYQWSDGDVITLELAAETGCEFVLDMLLRQQWMADVIGAEEV